MPKAFTDRENELIRRRLLEHGYTLFSAYGLKKTSIEELAKAAGISKGAFYGFYESKEALFMDVVEQAEIRLRQQVLAVVGLPGSSPRARLYAVLKKAFALFETIPILQFFTAGDYELLARRMPVDRLEEHLASDRVFFEELIAYCRSAGIPIRVRPEQFAELLYPLVLAAFQQERDQNVLGGSIDLLLELVAAFCLGEVEMQSQEPGGSVTHEEKGNPI